MLTGQPHNTSDQEPGPAELGVPLRLQNAIPMREDYRENSNGVPAGES